MDYRAPALLLFAICLGYWTWRANRSGRITSSFSTAYRDKQPRMFAFALWTQGALALAAAIMAVAAALGFVPLN